LGLSLVAVIALVASVGTAGSIFSDVPIRSQTSSASNTTIIPISHLLFMISSPFTW
jgi:hypothetical protein